MKETNLDIMLQYARKLNNIGRWSNEFLHRRASVAEHSFAVTQVAQMLGIIEETHGNSVDWKSLYRKALNHDVPEALVGDVISTTKNATAETKEALKEVEETLVNFHMLSKLNEPYRSEYQKILAEGKDDTLEGQILKYADNIDALIECIQEVELSNEYPFTEKYYMILNNIKKSNLVSVKIFLDEILPKLVSCSKLKD